MLGPSQTTAAARGDPALVTWNFGDWLRRAQAPPLGRLGFPKPAGGGNMPATVSLCFGAAVCRLLQRRNPASVLLEGNQKMSKLEGP